ncbi:MAG: hypothetical protein Kow0098_14380 [Ignavibacteriaceae bacterium]
MKITLYVSDNCCSCNRVRDQILALIKNQENLEFSVENINKIKSKGIFIVPALFIEDELYAYGDISKTKFLNYLGIDQSV